MKIEIRNLVPNPYRNISEYPISKDKVRSLVKSIKHTSFWDNILARESAERGKYEIAYGHHRLKALHEIYGANSRHEVDIPVRDLDDATMLKVMANENASDWALDTAVVMETIKATEVFVSAGGTTVRDVAQKITDFLGGVFTLHIVVDALAIIHAVEKGKVDNKAVRMIPAPTKAATFVAAINSLPEHKKPTPEKQREIAKNIVERETPRTRVKQDVEFAVGIYSHADREILKALPTITEFMWQHRAEVERLTKYLNELAKERDAIPNTLEWKSFRAACALLLTALNRLFGEGDAIKKGNGRGKKKERRAIEQRSARALLTK